MSFTKLLKMLFLPRPKPRITEQDALEVVKRWCTTTGEGYREPVNVRLLWDAYEVRLNAKFLNGPLVRVSTQTGEVLSVGRLAR